MMQHAVVLGRDGCFLAGQFRFELLRACLPPPTGGSFPRPRDPKCRADRVPAPGRCHNNIRRPTSSGRRASSAKRSPLAMTRFAIRPGAMVPRRSATPNISAGVLVSAARATSLLNPRRTARRRRDQNSFSGFSSFWVVKAIGDAGFGQARRIARGAVPVLQLVQIVFQRLLGAFDLGRFRKIERQNDGRFLLGQSFANPIFVAVAEQDRLQFEFIGHPQGAEKIELVLRFEDGGVALRLLSQRGQARVRFGAFRGRRIFPIRFLSGLIPRRIEKTLPDERDAPMSEFG